VRGWWFRGEGGEVGVDAQVDDRWGCARRLPQCRAFHQFQWGWSYPVTGKVSRYPHTNHTLDLIAINVFGGDTVGCSPILREGHTSNMVLWKA
jgi:hypothetical protein